MTHLSRQKLARFLADEIVAGRRDAGLQQVAAYLIEAGRVSESEQVIRSTEELLEERGHMVVRATTAHPLDATQKKSLKTLLNAATLEIESVVDANVLGGIRIETPSRVLDATVARRLQTLRESKA